MRRSFLTFIVLFTACPVIAQSGLDSLHLKDLFFEPNLAGVRPEFLNYSPDLHAVYFAWNDSSYNETGTYRVDLKGENVENVPDSVVTDYNLSPDHQSIVYTHDNQLMISDKEFRVQKKLVSSVDGPTQPSWSPDSKQIAFVNEGEVWVLHIDEASLIH